MSITLPALAIVTQVGSATINWWRNKRNSKELAQLQQAYEEKVIRDGIERARAEFSKLCAFQREMEKQAHLDRLASIQENLKQNLRLDAYVNSLRSWPLLVPPYVITNTPLTIGPNENPVIPLNCILTTSADLSFNNNIFNRLEEEIALFCSKNWNISANKPIRFFQEAWRDRTTDIGIRYRDVRSHLKNVPTLLISPVLRDNKLIFIFYWWGLSIVADNTHANAANEFYPELSITLDKKQKFESNEINTIIAECVPALEIFISFFADLYYWNLYFKTPSLPELIEENKIKFVSDNDLYDEIGKAFLESIKITHSSDIHENLLYLNEIKRLNISDQDSLKITTHQVLSKLLCVQSTTNRNDLLDDLVLNHNLYLYMDAEDNEIIENILNYDTSCSVPEKIQRNTIMDSKEYLKQKEQLLSLLKDIQKISSLPKANLHDFQQIERKIQEDQFRIALIGEYQGGKSTTFDALCGGREISPRGNNIKTSSCRITATNICDQEEEYASVIWKNDIELIKTMSPILDSIEPESLGYDPAKKIPFSYYQYLDLKNGDHRKLIEDAINHIDSSNASDELKDIILISKFIITFYNVYEEIKTNKRFTIEEASKLMTFPQNMIKRYNEGNGNVKGIFKENEALFAFVQTVHCHIHSNQLGELGCSFIDCPGLFASEYDTSIALETIETSDAVLYLLSGDKQIGQGDVRAIRTIIHSGRLGNSSFAGDNIFFAINQRKPEAQTSFIDLDLSVINQIFPTKNLHLFNALLFYYAEFGKEYLNNNLDEHTILKFLNSSGRRHYQSVPEKWISDVNRILIFLELDMEYQIDDMSDQSVEVIASISNNAMIMNQIKNYIVRNKAKMILIDNGAVRINDGLYAVEKALEYQESAARKDVSERAKELNSAKESLDKFCESIEKILENAFPEKNRKDYIQKIYKRYILNRDVVNEIALKATKSLLEYARKPNTKWTAITSKIGTKEYKEQQKAKLQDAIKAHFEKAIDSTVTRVVEKWINTHYNDEDVDFKEEILPLAIKLGEEIKKEWHNLIKATPVLSALCPSSIDTKIGLKRNMSKSISFDRHQIQDNTIEGTSNLAIADIVSQIISPIISTIVGIVVFHILDIIFTGGIATIYSVIAGILTHLGLRSPKEINSPEDLGKKGKQLYEKISSNLYVVLLNENVKDSLCSGDNGLSKVINEDVKMYSEFYRNELENKKQEFEANVLIAEKEYEKTKDQLDEIAKNAYDIRTKEVIPLRKRVTEFMEKI